MLDYVAKGDRIYRVVNGLLGEVQAYSYKVVNGIELQGLDAKVLEEIFTRCTNREIY